MALLLRRIALALIVVVTPVAAMTARPAAAADVRVMVDQAKLFKLPDRLATIVIGNPLIADAAVQPNGLIVITGKGYGTTNLIALDRAGNVIAEKVIQVRGPRDAVVMYRGVERVTYSCTPICERQLTLGDGPPYFDTALAQTAARNAAALGLGPVAK